MIATEIATLLKAVATAQGCSGPYLNVIPKQTEYPAIAFVEVSDFAIKTKDADLYGRATYEVRVHAKKGDKVLAIGPADICVKVDLAIRTALNGFLGSGTDDIVEIRWSDSEMDYNEEDEIHIKRSDFDIQHK